MLTQLFPDERPREKLERGGVEVLSDLDLVALVLGTGSRGRSALVLARELRLRYPTLTEIASASPAELAAIPGIGPCRAASLTAALELGRRADRCDIAPGQRISSSQEIFRHFHSRIGSLKQERFYVLMIDGKGRMMREVRISEGSLTASLVHPREVFRAAIREAAAAVALVHNHPSGDPNPSPEDITLTNRLRAAGELVGVRVVDHVVIGRGRYVSFVDAGQ